jgi:hypothetical protein
VKGIDYWARKPGGSYSPEWAILLVLAVIGGVIVAPSAAMFTRNTQADLISTDSLSIDKLFEGEQTSLAARAIGMAEGTISYDGSTFVRTSAWRSHVDPGNKVKNVGTFSYQHFADSPEDADRRQIARLKAQYQVISKTAKENNIKLNLEEQLNALDLANQAPLAALGTGNFVEQLAQEKLLGKTGREAIVSARTNAYKNPYTGLWNAPGLGNTRKLIERDQRRRSDEIAKAIQLWFNARQQKQS